MIAALGIPLAVILAAFVLGLSVGARWGERIERRRVQKRLDAVMKRIDDSLGPWSDQKDGTT